MGTAGAGIASVTAVEEAIAAAAAPWPIAVIMPAAAVVVECAQQVAAASMSAQAVAAMPQPYVRTHPTLQLRVIPGARVQAQPMQHLRIAAAAVDMPAAVVVVDMPAAVAVVVDMPAAVAAVDTNNR